MAQPTYDNQGNVVKKPFRIKIAGFNIGLKHIVIFAVIIGFIALSSFISSEKKRKADEAAVAQRMAELEALKQLQGDSPEYDLHAQIQKSLSEKYGIAPEGFEWGYTGELIALGDDDDHTCEDVVYMFIRALSILDFSTAQRYSEDSAVVADYQSYYSATTEVMTDYYRDFLRKQFKQSLTSLEVDGISDTAVFADGTQYVTLSIQVLDLQDKDFWKKDRDSLFEMMRVFKDVEADSVKMEQYVYDYIYEKYVDGTIGKRTHTIELVVNKLSGGGWLVSGDGELSSYLQYKNGVDVAAYILSEFNDWYLEVTLQEQLESIEAGAAGSGSLEPTDISGDEQSDETDGADNSSVSGDDNENEDESEEVVTSSSSDGATVYGGY